MPIAAETNIRAAALCTFFADLLSRIVPISRLTCADRSAVRFADRDPITESRIVPAVWRQEQSKNRSPFLQSVELEFDYLFIP